MSIIKHSRTMTLEELEELEKSSDRYKEEQGSLGREDKSSMVKGSLRLPKDIDKDKLAKDNRYYLPVLHINDPSMWESRPLSERLHFTPEVAEETCLSNCCGHAGVSNACCVLDPDDIEHVLGPVDEPWIKKMITWFKKKGINATRSDIVIDFEEGRLLGRAHFNGHKVFEDKKSYPILRIQAFGPRFACKFMNVHNGKCQIYEQRSDMCRGYYCQWIKSNFLVQDKNHPSKWIDLKKKNEKT